MTMAREQIANRKPEAAKQSDTEALCKNGCC